MASLITLLAVADILGNNTAAVATYSKRLVLTALMGEPWAFMGSKRLLWEMQNGADTTAGLSLDSIDQVKPRQSLQIVWLHLLSELAAWPSLSSCCKIHCMLCPCSGSCHGSIAMHKNAGQPA